MQNVNLEGSADIMVLNILFFISRRHLPPTPPVVNHLTSEEKQHQKTAIQKQSDTGMIGENLNFRSGKIFSGSRKHVVM